MTYSEDEFSERLSNYETNDTTDKIPKERTDDSSTLGPIDFETPAFPASANTPAPIHPSVRSLVKTFTGP